MRLLTALLASAFALGAAAGEAQLLPAGEFQARDGRPGPGKKWKVDDAQGQALAAKLNEIAAQTPIVIDYEHQTMLAEKNGQPAPAAGWMNSFEWRKGEGLFATVQWTERAKASILAGEYRFISPVIVFEVDSGRVIGLVNAALVNQPAILGMADVVAQLAAQFNPVPPETRMDLKALIALLGLKTDATEADVTAAIAKLKAGPALTPALATALGVAADATEQAALSALTALKEPKVDTAVATLITNLQGQVEKLTAERNDEKITGLVEAAIAANKLTPASRDEMIKLGKRDLALLTSVLGSMPVLPGLGGQTHGREPEGGEAGAGSLSRTQQVIATQLGLDPAAYAKTLADAAKA